MKKRFIRLLISAILLLLILPGSLTASASNYKEEKIKQAEESLDITVFYEEKTDRLIKTFDSNYTGWYAIVYNGWDFVGSNDNVISVYNSLGEFQYGLTFDAVGEYGIELVDNNVIIYRARSNNIAEIDSTGKCINAKTIHSLDIPDDVFNRTSLQVGNIHYSLDGGSFLGAYSRLVRTDDLGNKTILHEATPWGCFLEVFHYLSFIFWLIMLFYILLRKVKEDKKRRKAEQEKAAAADNNEPQNS